MTTQKKKYRMKNEYKKKWTAVNCFLFIEFFLYLQYLLVRCTNSFYQVLTNGLQHVATKFMQFFHVDLFLNSEATKFHLNIVHQNVWWKKYMIWKLILFWFDFAMNQFFTQIFRHKHQINDWNCIFRLSCNCYLFISYTNLTPIWGRLMWENYRNYQRS